MTPGGLDEAIEAGLNANDVSEPDMASCPHGGAPRERAWGGPLPAEVVAVWRTLR